MPFESGNKENAKRRGRPKANHTLLAEQVRAKFAARFAKDEEKFFQALKDLALGYKFQDTEDGFIYNVKPDAAALKYMYDQGIGRAKEQLEVIGEMTLKLDV